MKAIIFDADGMIVHGDRFSLRLADEFGISLETTRSFFTDSFPACLIGKADLKIELAKYLDQWGWTNGVDDLLNIWFDEKHSRIDGRFESIISEARSRGYKCYLATNNEKYRTENLIKDRGLGTWFDDVFPSAYIGAKKPQHAFFDGIFNNILEKKEEVIFWDDDQENIERAKSYGITAEMYTDFDTFAQKIKSEIGG